jgi:hypothetical protein
MIQETQTYTPRLPRILSQLSHANQYLKAFSIASLSIAALSTLALVVALSRKPVVLTLMPDGGRVERAPQAEAAEQVRAAAEAYLNLRYHWEPANVKAQLAQAQAFIRPASAKSYQAAIANLIRFSTEKQVSQRIYPEKIQVDLAKGELSVGGDRITSIQGLKAAGRIDLVLKFEGGPRTEANPWGLYIVQEKEVQ